VQISQYEQFLLEFGIEGVMNMTFVLLSLS